MIEIKEINNIEDRHIYNEKLLEFEKIFKYPIGQDYFTIDHGNDYFRFFDYIGKPFFFIVEKNNQIIAVSAAVLREIRTSLNKPKEDVWYLCDLKIHPDHQGQFILQKLLRYAFPKYSRISRKIYAITMNDNNSYQNRVVNLAYKLPYLGMEFKEIIDFYLLDVSQGGPAKSLLSRNKDSFVSLVGVKDLILQSNGLSLPILHLSKNPSYRKDKDISAQKKYMFCNMNSSQESITFHKNKFIPFASASLIANFSPSNWEFIESCDL